MKRTRITANRRGAALLLVLVAMVVLAVLSSASMMSAFQEARGSRAAQIQQRALTVAEYGLNLQLANWTSQRSGLALGAIDSSIVGVALGDTAVVRVQRLTNVDYQVVSIGRAGVGNGLLEAQRQVSLLVKMSAPTIRPGGIITSYGDVDIQARPMSRGAIPRHRGGPAAALAAGTPWRCHTSRARAFPCRNRQRKPLAARVPTHVPATRARTTRSAATVGRHS
ncbi:hypothetical protein [Gemmatimonas sp.]